MKGVAYQPSIGNSTNQDSTGSFVDPLSDPAGCTRDVPYLQALNANVVRVYAVDTTQDHSECMNTFAEAGTRSLRRG
jgi:1,3-beta-glucanosyltransferase GAS1